MKKALFILSAAAMLFAGCAKEALTENDGAIGGEQTVTFKVGLETSATKAVVDNDGNGAKVNHWIMEVLDEVGNRYNYQAHDADEGVLTHTFDVRLVKGQTYNVLFWADTKGTYDVAKLTQVKLANETGYAASLDSRDAFSAVVADFQSDGPSQNAVTLKRPLAQLNVIFTDLKALYETIGDETEYLRYKPQNFVVTAKVPTSFNVQTQTAGAPAATALTMTAADNYLNNYATHRAKETLYMDYFFATKDSKDVVDIDFAFESNGLPIAHKFTAVPFQRNYRTNVMGDLMSDKAKWNVEIDPIWDSKDDGSLDINVYYTEVSKGKDVGGAISAKSGDSTKDGQTLSVSIGEGAGTATVNDDIIIPDNTPREKTPEIILDFKTLAASSQIIIRDENHDRDAAVASEGAKEYEGEVIVVVPEGTTADQVKILTNKSTVTVRGEYGTVIASCAPQTIVVSADADIDVLKVMKGNVEVFGSVKSIVNNTAETEASKDVVIVYIYEGGSWTNVETEKNEKLVPMYPVAKIGNTIYFSLTDALAAVQDDETIMLVANVVLTEKLLINNGKEFTFDLGGKTLTGRVNVSGAKLTVKNGTIDAGSFAQALNVYGSKDLQYKEDIFTYVKVEKDVTLNGSAASLAIFSVYGDIYFPLSYGLKVDFYGKAVNEPAQVSGNIGYDNYVANIGAVDISGNLPAGITAPSKAMSLYGPEINIYGEMTSTASGNELQGFILSGMARVNVYEGAKVEGSDGFAMKSGNLTVYGGTIKSNGPKNDPIQAVSSGSEASGAAISVSSFYTDEKFADRSPIIVTVLGGDIQSLNNAALVVGHSYKDSVPYAFKQGVELEISGGEFTGAASEPVVHIANAIEEDSFPMPAEFITGGVYNKEPAVNYVDKAYKAVQRQDGKWIIGGPYEARIANVYYTTFTEAVAAVQASETITLLTNVEFAGIENVLLKNFTVDAQGKYEYNHETGSVDGYVSGYYIRDTQTRLLYYNGGKQLRGSSLFVDETLMVPEGVEEIVGSKSFGYCDNLKYVKLSSTVRTLGNRVFCAKNGNSISPIQKVYYKSGDEYVEGLAPYLTTIEGGAFQQTGHLTTNMVIPASINVLPANLFQESGIQSLTLHEGITEIGKNFGRNAQALTEITLPSTVTTIGDTAFRDCTNLKTINLLFENVPSSFGTFTFNATSAQFGATVPGVVYVKNQTVADALIAVWDSNAKDYYSIKNYDDNSIVYYTGKKL